MCRRDEGTCWRLDVSERTYSGGWRAGAKTWVGNGEDGAEPVVAGADGRGEVDRGGSAIIAVMPMISSCSTVVASMTCNKDVCCHPKFKITHGVKEGIGDASHYFL